MQNKCSADYAYLFTYPARYEPDMGVEFAQFPSKEYTDTYRTDVLYYAVSTDGKSCEALNNNKAVMFPEGCVKLGSPSLFRKADGSYGLIADTDRKSAELIIFDSDDLICFKGQRIVKLEGVELVKAPFAEYTDGAYRIYFSDENGNMRETDTMDLVDFSEVRASGAKRAEVTADLPDYALKEEASAFALTKEEYERIMRKFGKLRSVSVEVPEITVSESEDAVLPETVDVVYSDGSKTPMKVRWEFDGSEKLSVGEHIVRGRIEAVSEYNSPLAEFRADPYAVYDEENGVYYFTGSNMNRNSACGGGAYTSIVIRRSRTVNGITSAEEFEIWKDSVTADETRVTGAYWAPEIHKMGGKWRIIALATVTEKGEEHGHGRQCIFTCNGDDLTKSENWEYTGYIHDASNGEAVGAFDTTYFEYDGKSYYVTPKWAGLWIATVDPESPLYPTSPLVHISSADRAFETNIGPGRVGYNNLPNGMIGQAIEEASSVLIHNGKIFIVYAGCTIDMMYCVCAIYADLDSDLLSPESWKKYPYPLLATQDLTTTLKAADYSKTDGTTKVTGHGDSGLLPEAHGKYSGIFGPGHNSFTVDEAGNPIIIYHARDWDDEYPGAVGSAKYGLVDPGRHAYAKPVIFNFEGYPVCNLTPEEYLSEELRIVTAKITVKK